MTDYGQQTEGNRPIRDERGRFLNGCPAGPGRPQGSLDFMAICRRRAKAEGIDLEELVWGVAKALFDEASKGDVASAKLVLDRACGLLNKSPAVAVQVNQAGSGTVHIADQTRVVLRKLIEREDIQDVMLDELERRTMGEGC